MGGGIRFGRLCQEEGRGEETRGEEDAQAPSGVGEWQTMRIHGHSLL
jgi:hypothetical protein